MMLRACTWVGLRRPAVVGCSAIACRGFVQGGPRPPSSPGGGRPDRTTAAPQTPNFHSNRKVPYRSYAVEAEQDLSKRQKLFEEYYATQEPGKPVPFFENAPPEKFGMRRRIHFGADADRGIKTKPSRERFFGSGELNGEDISAAIDASNNAMRR